MQSFLMTISGFLGLVFIVSMIRPKLFGENFTRKKGFLYFGFGWIFLAALAGNIGGTTNQQASGTQTPPVVSTSTIEKAKQDEETKKVAEETKKAEFQKAQTELNDFVALGQKAGLISSYEFSDKANVVYVGLPWYGMTVQQKKDFMAYLAMKKKVLRGFNFFEVRDAYSNEKVGEVTSFMNSLEVYK